MELKWHPVASSESALFHQTDEQNKSIRMKCIYRVLDEIYSHRCSVDIEQKSR